MQSPTEIDTREKPKIVKENGQVHELRKLSPEEKAQRRARRNFIMLIAGLLTLIIAMAALLKFNG